MDLVIYPDGWPARRHMHMSRAVLERFTSLTGLTIYDLSTLSLLKFDGLFPKLDNITLVNPWFGLEEADFEHAAAAICRPGVSVTFAIYERKAGVEWEFWKAHPAVDFEFMDD